MSKAVRRNGGVAAEAINTVETPSSQIIKEAQREIETTDSLGRVLVVKRFGSLQRLRLLEMIGNLANNELYLSQVATACSVIRIDGEAVRFPQSKREMEALVDRLDDPGMGAANAALAKLMGIEVDPETGEVTTAASREQAKNLSATPSS